MRETKLLDGKNAIITGSNRGIGWATVEAFVRHGANVWACARTEDPEFEAHMKALADRYGVWIRPVYFDMRDEGAIKQAARAIMKENVPVHALVNIAGITLNALFQMTSMDKLKEQIVVNFYAPYLFTQNIVKLMIRNGKGSIVNISSSAGLDGNSGKSAYGGSKAAVIAATKSMAEELGKSGIRANCIAPGIVETDMLSSMPEQVINQTIASSDLRRAAKPVDIANTAVFLASDLSSYITGQVIRVDGGMH